MAKKGRLLEAAIIVLAIAARVAAVFVLRNHEVPQSTYEHGEIAANLLAGRGFSIRFLGADGPTSQQAPVYPVVVAAAYAIGGVETPRSLLLLELAQCLLGGLLAWGTMRLAGEIAPEQRGMAFVAGLIAAIHPTLVYAATHVQVAGLGATLLVWTLGLGYRTGTSGRTRNAALAGTLLALLALTDPILSLAALGIAWAVYQGQRQLTSALRLLAVTLAVALAGITPWVLRNARIHGEFVPIKSTFGYAFWQGNCARSEGTDKVRRASVERVLQRGAAGTSLDKWNRSLWAARHEAGYIDDIALTKDDRARLGRLSEPERSRVLFRRAIAELATDRWRYPRLCLRRLGYFVLFDETNPKSRSMIYRVPHVALTLLAAIGLVFAGRPIRKRLLPTIAVAAAVTLFHALTIVSARFHMPLEPLMAVWGAAMFARWPFGSKRGREAIRNTLAAGPHHVECVGVEDRLVGAEFGGRDGVELALGPGLEERQ
ncbi:MAG: hypothetical protein ACYC61_26280 [Isosphaeraceae bacterium]